MSNSLYSSIFYVLSSDGNHQTFPLPDDDLERLYALQAAVGGRIEYLSASFHTLENWDVVINESAENVLSPNLLGCDYIGFNRQRYRPLCGPIVLVPRRDTGIIVRAKAAQFFERLGQTDFEKWDILIDSEENNPKIKTF